MFLFSLIEPYFDSWPVTTCHWKRFTACSFTSAEGRLKPLHPNLQVFSVTIKDILEGFFETYHKVQLNVLPFLLLLPVVLGIVLHSFWIVYGDPVCLAWAKYLSLIRSLNMELFVLGLNPKCHSPPRRFRNPVTHFFKRLNRDIRRYAGIYDCFFSPFNKQLTKSSYITIHRYFMPNIMFHIWISETLPIMLFLFSQLAVCEEAQRQLRMQRC